MIVGLKTGRFMKTLKQPDLELEVANQTYIYQIGEEYSNWLDLKVVLSSELSTLRKRRVLIMIFKKAINFCLSWLWKSKNLLVENSEFWINKSRAKWTRVDQTVACNFANICFLAILIPCPWLSEAEEQILFLYDGK